MLKKYFSEEYLSEFVYGGIDGIVTTFAVVAAVAGANQSASLVLILGIANLISDGISMGISAYMAEKTDVDAYHKTRNGVVELLEKSTSKATTKVKKHLRKYGLKGKALDSTASTIAGSKYATDFIMREEHGEAEEPEGAAATGAMTFIAFMLFGVVPLLSYLADYIFDLELTNQFQITMVLAGIAFALIGYMKARVNKISIGKSVIETVLLGVIAAGASYYIGRWLEALLS